MSQVYVINKGVGKPVVFRGLSGQYIYYLGIGIAGLLLLFAFLYLVGVSLLICTLLVLFLGAGLFAQVYSLNRRYGVHGWMKQRANSAIPKRIFCDQVFKA